MNFEMYEAKNETGKEIILNLMQLYNHNFWNTLGMKHSQW